MRKEMSTGSGAVFQKKFVNAGQNFRKLIRRYSAGSGSDGSAHRPVAFLTNRSAASGGLAPLSGRARAVRGTMVLPPSGLAGKMSTATHGSMPLIPFAALPVCCALALTTVAADCDVVAEDERPSFPRYEAAAMALAWDVSVIRSLRDLRFAYDELVSDPLWQYAMEGAEKSLVDQSVGQPMDADDAIYELAKMTYDELTFDGPQLWNEEAATMDPLDALLELAQLG